MKQQAVTTLLKGFFHRAGISVHNALFRHMVKSGLVLCAVDFAEDTTTTETDDQGTDTQDDQTGDDDTGTAAGDDQGDGDKTGTEEDTDEEEVVVTIGEDSPTSDEEDISQAPEWVRNLRKEHRETKRLLREKDAEIERLKGNTGRPCSAS